MDIKIIHLLKSVIKCTFIEYMNDYKTEYVKVKTVLSWNIFNDGKISFLFRRERSYCK